METYTAKVRKSNGWYAIDFPDLPGTHAQCKDWKDVQKEAENSLRDFLITAKLVGEEIPTPSKSIELKEGETALTVTVGVKQ